METNYIRGMSERGEIIDAMKANLSEIEKERSKNNEEYDRRKEIDMATKQLDLAMRLSVYYGTF